MELHSKSVILIAAFIKYMGKRDSHIKMIKSDSVHVNTFWKAQFSHVAVLSINTKHLYFTGFCTQVSLPLTHFNEVRNCLFTPLKENIRKKANTLLVALRMQGMNVLDVRMMLEENTLVLNMNVLSKFQGSLFFRFEYLLSKISSVNDWIPVLIPYIHAELTHFSLWQKNSEAFAASEAFRTFAPSSSAAVWVIDWIPVFGHLINKLDSHRLRLCLYFMTVSVTRVKIFSLSHEASLTPVNTWWYRDTGAWFYGFL